MPTINNPISFSAEALEKIDTIKKQPEYTHKTWDSPYLESVRCEIRNFYRKEQRLNCVYCQEQISVLAAASAPVEHIIPKSSHVHFMFEPKNLCVVCGDCNEFKRAREVLADHPLIGEARRDYPVSSDRYRTYHPHIDEYHQHIIKAGFIYLERSKKGGYTIYVCNLNRFLQTIDVSEQFLSDLTTLAEAERFHRS